MDIVHFSLHFHWPGGAGRSTENGDRLSDSAITPMAMVQCRDVFVNHSTLIAKKVNLIRTPTPISPTVTLFW